MDFLQLSWESGLEMSQPVTAQDSRDLFVIIPFRCQDRAEFLQVGYRIQPGRNCRKAEPAIKIAANAHVPGIPSNLANMVHMGCQGFESNTVAQVAKFPSKVQELAKRHHTDNPIPFENIADDVVPQQAVPVIAGEQRGRVGMADNAGYGV